MAADTRSRANVITGRRLKIAGNEKRGEGRRKRRRKTLADMAATENVRNLNQRWSGASETGAQPADVTR